MFVPPFRNLGVSLFIGYCHEIVNLLASEKTVCSECGSEKLVKWNPVKGRCPKCGKKMKETGVIMMVD